MNAIVPIPITTTDQLLAFGDDGVERELIRGHLVEKPMTLRNYPHSTTMMLIGAALLNWDALQPKQGSVAGGEVAFRLRRNPDTAVGIDVAYLSPELTAATQSDASIVDGVPLLAVEVLSPSDKHDAINDKIDEYLAAGVRVIWIVDTHFRTVRVHRQNRQPEFFHSEQQLRGDPELPGFEVAVAKLFR